MNEKGGGGQLKGTWEQEDSREGNNDGDLEARTSLAIIIEPLCVGSDQYGKRLTRGDKVESKRQAYRTANLNNTLARGGRSKKGPKRSLLLGRPHTDAAIFFF